MILNLISQGIAIILVLTFSFGPAFFALINAGIREGYKHGSLLAIGIVLSDLMLCVLVCILVFLGAGKVLNSESTQNISAIIGGIILIIFGVTYFLKKNNKSNEVIETGVQPSALFLITKGFLLNLFNPAVWLLWLGNVTVIGKTVEYSFVKMISFFLIILGIVLVIELGKVFLAGKIKHYLTDKMMHAVNYVTGSVLLFYGLFLIYNHTM